MAKITGRENVERKLKQIGSREKIEAVGRALFEGGEAIKAEAQVSITTGATSGKNHVPSKPGDPPNEDTGDLRRGIIVTQPGPLNVRISSNAPYSTFLEFGTSRMGARPFMGPAARKRKDEVIALVRRAIDQAIGE